MFSGIYGQRRPRSACASAQSDLGLRCPLIESLYTIECINGEQMPGWDFAHARDESESIKFAHVRRHLFARRRPIISMKIINRWEHFTFPFFYFLKYERSFFIQVVCKRECVHVLFMFLPRHFLLKRILIFSAHEPYDLRRSRYACKSMSSDQGIHF